MKKLLMIFIGILAMSLSYAQGPLSCNPTAIPSEVCQGELVQLFAYASGGSEEYTFMWTSTPPGFSSDLPNPVVNPNQTITYHLTVNDGYGTCQGDITVMVTPLPVPDAGPDKTIANGTSTVLEGSASEGSGNYSYHWEPENRLVNPNDQYATTVNLISTTWFSLSVTDLVTGCVCSTSDNVIISVLGSLNINPTANPEEICTSNTVQLTANAGGGSGLYEYYWTSNPPGFTSTEANPLINPITSTMYYVEVTDGYAYASDSVLVSVYSAPEIYTLSNGGQICPNSSGIEIILNNSQIGVSYELYRYNTTTGITILGTGGPISFGYHNQVGEYNVFGFNDVCQVQMNNVAVISYPNFKDEICIINVDSLTGKNVIIWNKTDDNAISSYNIYQESTSGGNYSLIGNVEHNDPGIFMDNSTNPLQRSFSYAIATIDTCGAESTFSGIHTTMHLSINAGINSYNLIWTPYAGIEYLTYYIYRRQPPDGFQILDSVPNSIHSYSDINAPLGTLDYVIEIRNENGCNPGKGQTQYSSVFSNIISTNVGIDDVNSTVNGFRIHPNPAEDCLYISSNFHTKLLADVFLYDLQGRMIIQDRFTNEKILIVKDLNPGVYFLVLAQSNYSQYFRVIVK